MSDTPDRPDPQAPPPPEEAPGRPEPGLRPPPEALPPPEATPEAPGATEAVAPEPAPPELPSYPRTPGTPERPDPAAATPELPSYPRDPGTRMDPMLEGPELPSYPRERAGPPSRPMSGLQRGVLLALAVIALLFVAQALTRDRAPAVPGESDAIARAVARASAMEMALSTDDPARARQFIRDEFGWRVGVPVFEGVELQGVGISELAPSVEVPAFLYLEDNRGREVVVFALSYALLDQVPERLRLARADYERLAVDPRPSSRRHRGQNVLLWRDRDDIYVAVTEVPPAQLTRRLTVAR